MISFVFLSADPLPNVQIFDSENTKEKARESKLLPIPLL